MINKATLIGNLGKDPDIRSGQYGDMATFSVATTENWKDKQGEWQSKTEWHSVVAYGFTVKSVENLQKGDQVFVEGQITYTKKDDRFYTNIKARIVRKLGRKDRERSNGHERTESSDTGFGWNGEPGYGGTGEDVPF